MKQTIVNNSLDPAQLPVNESLFTLANGYIGVRGNFEEGYPPAYATIQGTYINGFYDTVPMLHAEKQVGDPETIQKQLNVIDAQGLQLYIGEDREAVSPFNGELLHYERSLDLENGSVLRRYRILTPKGREIEMCFQRMVSFSTPELFIMQLEIKAINFQGPACLVATVNGDVQNHTDENDPRVASGYAKRLKVIQTLAEREEVAVVAQTLSSGLRCCCTSTLATTEAVTVTPVASETEASLSCTWQLKDTAVFTKYVVYTDSLRHLDPLEEGRALLARSAAEGFNGHLQKQRRYMDEFWRQSDIEIGGDADLQDGIRFNLFHLLQASSKDPHCSVAAKGLSGEGYEGHYFWDTEIYILPFFIMTYPELAKNMLLFRSRTLPDALERAKELGHRRGALFPWRTISGQECSGFFPAGAAQYHISADIAYAFIQYYLATGDLAFMARHGAEVVFETARLWLDTGHFSDGIFRIDCVTGPDEYTAIVNNNYYTNKMAQYNLRWAVKLRNLLQAYEPETFNALLTRIAMKDTEFDACAQASDAMFLPYSDALDIHEQDDSFLNKALWDFSRNPSDGTPLLLHFPPLMLYRHQVCKQADVVLSHFLLEEGVAPSTLKNSYDYYEKITTFDSSLTACIYSIMASRLGMEEKALDYFNETVRLDLDNAHLNTRDGLHMASMGGTWMALIYGFAGLRLHEEGLSLNPALPESWAQMKFSLRYHESDLNLLMTRETLAITVTGPSASLTVNGSRYTVSEEAPLTLTLQKAG